MNKRYNEVSFLKTHNSFSSKEDKFRYPNQEYNISRQLEDGVRGINLDIYQIDSVPYVYHSFKIIGKRKLVDVFCEIESFLSENPTELVTLFFECYCPFEMIEADMVASGLDKYLFTKGEGLWPLVSAMCEDDKRLVVFSQCGDAKSKGTWYNYIWDYCFDTHWKAHKTTDFSCKVHRGNNSNDLFLLNNSMTKKLTGSGSRRKSRIVNDFDFLQNRIKNCYQECGRYPNFISVDFYDQGDALKVIHWLNSKART